ncbi:type VI secretion protein IcmF [compost metagenome]
MTQQFASLHKMTEAVEGAQIPMDQLREALAFCGSYLVARQAAAASGLPAPEVNALENLRSLVDTLPTILKPLFIELIETGDDWLGDRQSERLVQEWKKNLEPYCRVVEQHYPFDRNAKADLPLKDFNQLFSSQGRLQMFVQTQLTAGSEHSFHSFGRQPLDDGVEASAFTQFKRAELIGNVFFPAGAAQARIDFELTPITMDEEIASFSLSLDDRQLSYAHGPVAPSMFTWPAQALGSSLKAVVTLFDGRTLRLSEQGGWAWFRLLGRGTLTQGPSRDTQWLTLSFEGYEVVLQIRYDSVEHGVDAQLLREFRCPTL